MRIKETKLGSGLSRLEVEPMCCSEHNIPTDIVDKIMLDIIKRKSNESLCCRNEKHCTNIGSSHNLNAYRQELMNEPDGIDIHVDRPVRENFFTFEDWRTAMIKYHNLEKTAKSCDWECREPMKGICDSFDNDEYEFDEFDNDEYEFDEFDNDDLEFLTESFENISHPYLRWV